MALNWGSVAAFGLREIRLYDSAGNNGIPFPASLLLHFTPRLEEFSVEGIVVRSRTVITALDWEAEMSTLDFSAYARVLGLSSVAAGSTPNRTLTLDGRSNADLPYFMIFGRSVADIGDVRVKMYSAQVTSIEFSLRDGSFLVSSLSGVAVDRDSNGLFDVVTQETASAL